MAAELASRKRWEIKRRPLNPYSMGDLEQELLTAAEDADSLVVDLSCLTRPHVLATARCIAGLGRADNWNIAYTSPTPTATLTRLSPGGVGAIRLCFP